MRRHIRSAVLERLDASRASPLRVLISAVLLATINAIPVLSKNAETNEPLLTLVQKLANSPQLLSYPYLASALGRPGKVTVLPTGTARQAQWFALSSYVLRYSLEQEIGPLIKAGEVENKFEVYLTSDDGIHYSDLVGHFGTPIRSAFDNRYDEKLKFTVAPYTILEARRLSCAPLFGELTLTYRGPVKPRPTEEDCLSALRLRREVAFAEEVTYSNVRVATLLSAYLQDAPADAEAHLKLGEIYKRTGCLNEAIEQFKLAYTLPWSDEKISKTALDRLISLSIVPARQADRKRPLENAQYKMTVAGKEMALDVGF
jgi:hypothetical protein